MTQNTEELQQKHWGDVYCLEGYTMTPEQQEAMYNEVYRPIVDNEKEIARSNARLLRAIKSVKGEAFHKNLCACLKELSDNCYNQSGMKYEIVRKPVGKFQKERWGREIKGVWCDQWATGGDGDSWSGYMCILIKTERWLKVYYEM